MIEVKALKLGMDMNSKVPVIVLENKGGGKSLLMGIGLFEAQAIASALDNVKPPRPSTHDLAKSLIEKLNGKVDRVIISDFVTHTFYARILIRRNVESVEVDSRPSDAIALARRLKVPIFIDERVWNKLAGGSKPIGNEEAEDFKRKLKNLRPEDFSP